ncbi:MAG: hypothetical protein H6834_13120 [Planctomycetes bacterium]|nr:hypothetical protein [Planctomycetota bacterium]
MRGLEKLTYVRLAEALNQTGSVPQDRITALLQDAEKNKQPLPELVVRENLMSEWELLQVVSEHFSLPVIFPAQQDLNKDLVQSIDIGFLETHNVVPMGKFGEIMTLIMPILTPFPILEKLEQMTGCEVFPYVGLISENTRAILGLVAERKKKGGGDDWESLFDEADATVQKSMGAS